MLTSVGATSSSAVSDSCSCLQVLDISIPKYSSIWNDGYYIQGVATGCFVLLCPGAVGSSMYRLSRPADGSRMGCLILSSVDTLLQQLPRRDTVVVHLQITCMQTAATLP